MGGLNSLNFDDGYKINLKVRILQAHASTIESLEKNQVEVRIRLLT